MMLGTIFVNSEYIYDLEAERDGLRSRVADLCEERDALRTALQRIVRMDDWRSSHIATAMVDVAQMALGATEPNTGN